MHTFNSDRHTAMNRRQWWELFLILALIVVGNLGGLWLMGAI